MIKQVLDVLELPQLLDACIKGKYARQSLHACMDHLSPLVSSHLLSLVSAWLLTSFTPLVRYFNEALELRSHVLRMTRKLPQVGVVQVGC